jgi:hypothetical protein
MESDSSDVDEVDKSEKEILELQKLHFLNNGIELLNGNEYFKTRKTQLQNSNDNSNDFEFTFETDDNDDTLSNNDIANSHSNDNNKNNNDINEKENNSMEGVEPTQISVENYKAITNELAKIIIKTLETGFMVPLTKTIKKSYINYIKSQMKNNPNIKKEPNTISIINSPIVNDSSIDNNNNTNDNNNDNNKEDKNLIDDNSKGNKKKKNNKNTTKTNTVTTASVTTTTTTTTTNTDKSTSKSTKNKKKNTSLDTNEGADGSANTEIIELPVPEIPKKRKRGRPPKNKKTGVSTSSAKASTSSTPVQTTSNQQSSKNKNSSSSSKITFYFNSSDGNSNSKRVSSEKSSLPTKSSKRRKTKASSSSDNQTTLDIQNYFVEHPKEKNSEDDSMKVDSISIIDNDEDSIDDKNISAVDAVKLFKCTSSSNAFKCFFPSCNKTFIKSKDLIQHLSTFYHDIALFIENRYIEKYCCGSGLEVLKLYKKLPLADNHYETPKKYNIVIINRKLDVTLFKELPIKLNLSRKGDISVPKKITITKNEKNKVYPPYPNRDYQIELKKDILEWKTMEYEHIRPKVKDFEIVTEKKIVQYTKFANQISVKFKYKSKMENSEVIDPFGSTSYKMNHPVFIFNSGGSVWGLDWCPIIGKQTQYLAVGGFQGTTDRHYVIGEKKSEKGCIQIWNVGKISDENNDDIQQPYLDLVLLHDYGYVSDLKWCPYGAYELESLFEEKKKKGDPNIKKDTLPRLGILAASFGDGSTKLFIIPHPHVLKKHIGVANDEPLYVNLAPILQFSHPDTSLWKCTWGHNKLLAVACTNGCIAVYNIKKLFNSNNINKDEISEPYLFFPAHDACVQKIEFYDEMKATRQHYWGKTIESENDIGNPSLLISCSNDGKLFVYDLKDPWTNCTLVRLRAFFITASWVPHLDSIILGTIDNDVRMLNLKESCEFDKNDQKHDEGINKPIGTKALTVHNGSLWDMECSKYNSYIISGGVDGKLKLANSYYWYKKKMKVFQTEIYQMEWDTKKNQLTFIEGFSNEEINIVNYKNSNSLVNFFPPEIAIQKVKWNLNKESTLWVASGLANGLVRIEFL